MNLSYAAGSLRVPRDAACVLVWPHSYPATMVKPELCGWPTGAMACAALVFAALLAPASARANGVKGVYLIGSDALAIHLSDRATSPSDVLLVAANADSAAIAPSASLRPAPHLKGTLGTASTRAAISPIVQRAAVANALDPDLLHAVIAAESGYVAAAVSRKGALGLMQLMPATARGYGVTNPIDVDQNVTAGAAHLRSLLDQFDQNVELALAAYNAGAAAVIRHGRTVPPFVETMAYVPRVLRYLAQLKRVSMGTGGVTTLASARPGA